MGRGQGKGERPARGSGLPLEPTPPGTTSVAQVRTSGIGASLTVRGSRRSGGAGAEHGDSQGGGHTGTPGGTQGPQGAHRRPRSAQDLGGHTGAWGAHRILGGTQKSRGALRRPGGTQRSRGAHRSPRATQGTWGAHRGPDGHTGVPGSTQEPGGHSGVPAMHTGSGSLSPSRRSHPEVPEDAEPRPLRALRVVPPPAGLAEPFRGGRGRPFPAGHLGTSLEPLGSGSFSHFTSH